MSEKIKEHEKKVVDFLLHVLPWVAIPIMIIVVVAGIILTGGK